MRLKDFDFSKPPALHYAALITILVIGLALRFWQLDAKPLWLDEVLTALFAQGHSYRDVPLDQFFPLTALDQIFRFQPGVSCPEIAQTVATESVHPPLFFCLLYGWMDWLRPDAQHWIWALRSLPALFGVGAIAAVYLLNRVAFSPSAGLIGAALMAVSPFAVYLSQEARHYTLPMLLITLALAGLVQIQQDLARRQPLRPLVWVGWSVINIISLYVHYFCLLSLIAQVTALTGWMLWCRKTLLLRHWGAVGLAIAGIVLSYLPWLPHLMNHFSRPETDWLIPYKPDWLDRLEPLYQTLIGWIVMVIALPVEKQPRQIAIPAILLILVFVIWLVWQIVRGSKQLWQHVPTRPSVILLASFTGCVLLQFFAIVYLLNKDLTVVPRYNFVYYPGVCALLGASLVQWRGMPDRSLPSIPKLRFPLAVILLVGLVSSACVVHGLVFQKAFYPDKVAKFLTVQPSLPLEVVVSYRSAQEVALGLSIALELRKLYPENSVDAQVRFAFLDRAAGYEQVWQNLAQLSQPLPPPLNLWIVASPGMRTKDYPRRLKLSDPSISQPLPKAVCNVDPSEFYRLGFPYQLFRCQSREDLLKSESDHFDPV